MREAAIALLASALLGVATDAAATPPAAAPRFRFARTLTPSSPGPTRVDVDVALLAGAEPGHDLRDLRITTASGDDVPYILVEPARTPPETWLRGSVSAIPTVSAKTSGVPAGKDESGFEVDLQRIARVDRLRLGGLPRPLLKEARVEGSGDRSHYTVLAPHARVFDLPDEQLRSLDVPLPDGRERYLRVTWDDHATAPVGMPGSIEVREVTPVSAPEPLRADVRFERRPSRTGESRFRVHLPAAAMPVVALELDVGGGNLLRRASVTEPELAGDVVTPARLGAATLRRSMRGALAAASLAIPITRPRGKDLDLVVDDGDNPPLDLTRVHAVFADQPWIYLEAPGTAPLEARYGEPNLARPEYDLEAVRGALDQLKPATAAWGAPRPQVDVPSVPPPPPLALAGAPLETAGFAFSRLILPSETPGPGLSAIALDAAVLAHSASLADLRIQDVTGHQVPYLLERRDEPVLIDLRPATVTPGDRRAPKPAPKTSLYRLDLPYGSLPPAELVLRTDARVFTRRVSLLAARPEAAPARDPDVTTVQSRDWTHADEGSPAPPLTLAWAMPGVSAIYVQIDEGDNAPLPLTGARLELPGARLRFFHDEAPQLTLYYGDPSLSPPRYDLALLAPTLAGAVGEELALGPEARKREPATPRERGLPVFWVVLGGAVLVLLLLMGTLLRKPAPGA